MRVFIITITNVNISLTNYQINLGRLPAAVERIPNVIFKEFIIVTIAFGSRFIAPRRGKMIVIIKNKKTF